MARRRTRSSTDGGDKHMSQPMAEIPFDLIIEILSRLPVKSIARFRCLSKLWSSRLRLPYFTDLFSTRSCARPKILFACKYRGELFFFSMTRDGKSFSLVANYHMKAPCPDILMGTELISPNSSGLVCIRCDFKLVLCNPSTGQSFTLPEPTKKGKYNRIFSGYDPIEKQFKVLSMPRRPKRSKIYSEHEVLTLGTEIPSWRMIKCGVPHEPEIRSICISGVLYYIAVIVNESSKHRGVICFDVRSEKYSFLIVPQAFRGVLDNFTATWTNYKGKLASIRPNDGSYGTNRCFEMYVLEDLEKQKWSKLVYELPSLRQDLFGEHGRLRCVGLTSAKEIVFSSYSSSHPFCIYYYNMERKTVTARVEIQEMEAFKGDYIVWTFLDHVEDLTYMQAPEET